MKAIQIVLITLVVVCLINWCRQGNYDESIFRVLPGLGGREISIYDLAGILCIGWLLYRILRLTNREK